MDPNILRRFVQHAMTSRIFFEPKPGHVRHTAVSRMLAEDLEAMDAIGFLLNDMHPASTRVIEALEKHPAHDEPNDTGFNIENNTQDTFYIEIGKDSERAQRFGGRMRWMTRGPIYDRHLAGSRVGAPQNSLGRQ